MTSTAKNILLIVVLVIIIGLGSWFYFRTPAPSTTPVQNTNTNPSPITTQPATNNTTNTNASTGTNNSTSTTGANVNVNVDVGTTKEFTVVASNFAFNTKEIKVNKGDRVKINFKSNGGSHAFAIDSYGIKSNVLGAGENQIIEFVADHTGTFEFYCPVGNHRAMGMVGNLIVQ